MSDPILINPSFKPRTPVSRKMVLRIFEHQFGANVEHPDIPGYHPTADELTAERITCECSNGKIRHTFALPRYIKPSTLSVHQIRHTPIAFPVQDFAQPQEYMARPVGHSTSLCEAMLETVITSGATPRMMDQTHVTLDFNCSIRTALELGAAVWAYPDLNKIQINGDTVIDFTKCPDASNNALVVTGVQPVRADQLVVYKAAINEIQNVINQVKTSCPEELVHSLLPLSTMVTSTVTKHISGWRQFLLSQSESLESSRLRVLLFKYFDDAAHSLFVGCEKALDVYRCYRSTYGLED